MKFLSLKTVFCLTGKVEVKTVQKNISFDINEDLDEPIRKSGVLEQLITDKNYYFEIEDSRRPNSSRTFSSRAF